MKYQFNTPLLLTSCFLFILVNNKSIAAPDAGSLLKQEEEIYKYYKDPLIKLKKKKKLFWKSLRNLKKRLKII